LIAPQSRESTTTEGIARERVVKLSALQSAMILAMGLQRKTIEEVAEEISLEPNQVLAQFTKIIKKTSTVLQEIQRASVASEMPQLNKLSVNDANGNGETLERMEVELESAAKEIRKEFRAAAEADLEQEQENDSEKKMRQRELLNSLDLSQ
jgi:N-acetyltransferase 10